MHRSLIPWYRRCRRDLPWRRTRDPYRVWVSEIMLQQTRVEAVIPYYERFLERYPDVDSLAAAPEEELLEAWAGLGYYRRARQLHEAAKRVAQAGVFPRTLETIRELPGIGDYTAAAVASIAFEEPHVVLDGNVLRVVSRLEDDARDITRGPTRKAFRTAAQAWMDAVPEGDRGDFNQALMELGATVCTPRSPRCLACPLLRECKSFKRGTQSERPVKATKQKLQIVELTVAVVRRGGSLLMRRRPHDEKVMPGFWELPQVDGPPEGLAEIGIAAAEKIGEFRHGITFRSFRGAVYASALEGPKPEEYRWVSVSKRKELPVTTITKKALSACKIATSVAL